MRYKGERQEDKNQGEWKAKWGDQLIRENGGIGTNG